MNNLTIEAELSHLRTENEALKTIISMMPGNVYWKDANGVYLGCNNNVAKILGLTSSEEIIGKRNEDIMPAGLAKRTTIIDNEVLKSGVEKIMEEKGINITGANAIYLTNKTPFYDSENTLKGIMGISFDITERKYFEEKLKSAKYKAESANRAKSRFLAMISHELRTPLTSILGFTNLIEQSDLDEDKRKEYVKYINDSGSYLLSLINSILDYNTLETSKFELLFSPINLKKIAENIINMLTPSAKLKNLYLTLEYDTAAPEIVMNDNRIMKQILINLVGNAIKFTEKGGITIKVQCVRDSQIEAKLLISVEDTGIGIPEKELYLIFKRFYQLGNVYTRSFSLAGTGLGLAIVKKMMSLINSKINVKSEVNKGSTFYFAVDFPKVSIESAPWLPYAAKTKLLFIIDTYQSHYIHSMLFHANYDIVNSKEALNLILNADKNINPYDVILIDSELKTTCANELLQQIQARVDIIQPLSIFLKASYSTMVPERFFATISLDLTKVEPRIFQKELKKIWQNWQSQNTSPPIQLTSSVKPKILMVEDNKLIQILHKHILEELNCQVEIAETTSEALEKLSTRFDMLFVDIGLPDIAGFELIREVRLKSHYEKQIPIIVLTGYSEDEERSQCVRAGANEVFVKPVGKNNFEAILKKYTNKILLPTNPI